MSTKNAPIWARIERQHARPLNDVFTADLISAIAAEGNTAKGYALQAAQFYYGLGLPTKDHAQAFAAATRAAEADHPWGHFYAGVCLCLGQGVEKDPVLGLQHLLLAANKGLLLAQHDVAMCHLFGIGTTIAPTHGQAIMACLADQGMLMSQFMLGWCLEHGHGCKENREEAIRLYQALAANGLGHAIDRLTQLGVATP